MEKNTHKQSTQLKYQISRQNSYQPCFQDNASFVSRIFFAWTHHLIRKGNQKHLEMQDLSDISLEEDPKSSSGQFTYIYENLLKQPDDKKQSKKLFTAYKKYLGPRWIVTGLFALLANLLQFSGPLAVGKILKILNSEKKDSLLSQGFYYVSILILCFTLRIIIIQHCIHSNNLSCIKLLNTAHTTIYKKILTLSTSSCKYFDTGSIMNSVNIDTVAVYSLILTSNYFFISPIMILVAICILITQVGWIGFIAPVMFIIGMLGQQKFMEKGLEIRKQQLIWADQRSKSINQYFSGIRIIKYYGWEQMVTDKIQEIRQKQLALNYKFLILKTYIQVLLNMLPIFSSIIIFALFVKLYGEETLTTSKVYTVLSTFNLISLPMRQIIVAFINLINGRVSLNRIEKFLDAEEKNEKNQIELLRGQNDLQKEQKKIQQQQVGIIQMKNCRFSWQSIFSKQRYQQNMNNGHLRNMKKNSVKIPLQNNLLDSLMIQMTHLSQPNRQKQALAIKYLLIRPGQFVTVVGKVGSGKSTFLHSILGELNKLQGELKIIGKISYIPQISWLRSATIRQNIVFQNSYKEQRYENILEICELKQDLQILGGDLTEIGEKGVNLSGGQKQRISIARAIYNGGDIYLIDDCLSALDAEIGKKIFYNVIKKMHEAGKTIIFVTNAMTYAQKSQRVIVIDNGRIIQNGFSQDLIKNEGSHFNKLRISFDKKIKQEKQAQIRISQKENQLKVDIFSEGKAEKVQLNKKNKSNKIQGLVKVEERLRGSVPLSFYVRFFTGPGTSKTFFMFLFILLAQCARVGSDWWLGQWGRKEFQIPQNYYMWIYLTLSIVVATLLYTKGIFFAKFIITSSRVIQQKLLGTLLKSPLSWFDVTPTGRILARTTKDQDDLDNNLSANVQSSSQSLFVLITSIIVISIAAPLYLIVAIITGLIYLKFANMYMNSSRQIKRLQSNTKAPLISHFQQTISGLIIIRALKKQSQFLEKYFKRQKQLIVTTINQNMSSRWIAIMTDFFSVLSLAATGYLGVVWSSSGKTNDSLFGLALVWSLQINGIMSMTLKIMADTQSNMNAVVRLYEYIDNNPSEKDFEVPKPKKYLWPTKGIYNISKASFKYRPQLPLVLKQLTFDIKQNSKIGIVGRSGSGKSTITLALLRILQISKNQDQSIGKIILDQQNIAEVGLYHIRHNIAIIPQDPVLFTGTVRSNIDPFNKYLDDEIKQCLKKVELGGQVANCQNLLLEGLESKIEQSGRNFSLGQRQLICLARALIRRPKILLMDEATASIDEKTDEKIQKMIRTQFKNTTVITIAHRLNTILHYDKILVLNNGKIQEYDSPIQLINNPDSYLGKSIRRVGKVYLQKLLSQLNQ